MMLKLTSRQGREAIYIFIAHIAAIRESGAGATIHAAGVYHDVWEKPSEIMAMPEMVQHLNPAFLVESEIDAFKPVGQNIANLVDSLRDPGTAA